MNWLVVGMIIGSLVSTFIFGYFIQEIQKRPCLSKQDVSVTISGEVYYLK